MKSYLFLDYETRCTVDLKATGIPAYARLAQPILAAWVLSDTPYPEPTDHYVRQWDYFEEGEPYPRELLELLRDPSIRKSAFNAPFEMYITRDCFKVPVNPQEWVCTMAWAYSRGFTGGLEAVGKAIGLPEDLIKMSEGRSLIKRFSTPRSRTSLANPRPYFEPRDDPDLWEKFRMYNRRDVVAEISIAKYLSSYPWTEEEHALWVWDRQINERGLPVDRQYVQGALLLIEKYSKEYLERLTEITGLDNPNSRDQLLQWVQNKGVGVNDLQAGTIEDVLATKPPF